MTTPAAQDRIGGGAGAGGRASAYRILFAGVRGIAKIDELLPLFIQMLGRTLTHYYQAGFSRIHHSSAKSSLS